jgi:hypothetical protein
MLQNTPNRDSRANDDEEMMAATSEFSVKLQGKYWF